MSLSPETRDRLIANMREAYRRAVDQVQYFGASEDGIPAPMEAALAVVLDDPQVTITERDDA